ncbi:MAG: winged helix-turn-helix transcriptional regulator [Thermoguttaceae bacterium]
MSRPNVSAAGMRIMKLLIGRPPQKMNDLIKATGVTRTAITEQINELISSGLVEQNIERLLGRGRPRFLYSATARAQVVLFEGNQTIVVPAIWEAIQKFCINGTFDNICGHVAARIAEPFIRQISSATPAERLKDFYNLTCSQARLIQLHEDDDTVSVSKLSCPFVSMFDDEGVICSIDQNAMKRIVGPEISRITSRHDNNACCVFAVPKS